MPLYANRTRMGLSVPLPGGAVLVAPKGTVEIAPADELAAAVLFLVQRQMLGKLSVVAPVVPPSPPAPVVTPVVVRAPVPPLVPPAVSSAPAADDLPKESVTLVWEEPPAVPPPVEAVVLAEDATAPVMPATPVPSGPVVRSQNRRGRRG